MVSTNLFCQDRAHVVAANTGISYTITESSVFLVFRPDNASAAWCLVPALLITLKSYSISRSLQLASVPAASAKLSIHFKTWQSALTVTLVTSEYGGSRTIAQTNASILDVMRRSSFLGHSIFWTTTQLVCRRCCIVSVGERTLSVYHRCFRRRYNVLPSQVGWELVGKWDSLARSAVRSILLNLAASTPLLVLLKVKRLAARWCEESLGRIYRRDYTTWWKIEVLLARLGSWGRV